MSPPVRLVLSLAVLVTAARAEGGQDDPVNLLRLSVARIESSSVAGDAAALAPLTDGDPRTVAEVAATEAAPLDMVFAFGGAIVAPEGVRVALPAAGAAGAPAARVEVLVSTLSGQSGFRSLRSDSLVPAGKPALLRFPPAAARWILVRLVPAAGAKTVAAAEVEILGREGEPKSRYAFAESPAKAFDVLQRLEKTTSLRLIVSDDEKAMFAKAKAGRLSPAEFAEAALLASGVLDAAKRREYLGRLDALEQQARAAVVGARTPAERADLLLQWLHKGPMAKGYVANQTDLSAVLDTQTFNCVSSATLYNALALRLGLDVRAIEVPDHAFSICYEDTTHMDVETTTPSGFHPARDRAAVERFEKMTGFRYIPDAHRDQRREVEEAGLAAITYYNHGVMLAREKRYHEALLANFRAMSLDPEFGSAVKNALAVLASWGVELSQEGKFQDALHVVATGLSLAPQDAALVNNRQAIWSKWALTVIDEGKPEEALTILRRAADAVPDGGFGAMQAFVYVRPADRLREVGRWDEALTAAEAGMKALEGGPREELAQWLGYFTQEWSKAAAARDGEGGALEVLRLLVARFPENPRVAAAASNHVRGWAQALAKAEKFEEALTAMVGARDLVPVPEEVRDLSIWVYDSWAQRDMKAGAWERAAEVYARALAAHPGESLIERNVAYLAQEWAKAAYAKGGAEAAAAVAATLAAKFPGVAAVAEAGDREIGRAVRDLARAGKHEEALTALDQGKDRLREPGEAQDLYFLVYDGWAKREKQAGRWEQAAEIYGKGLARFPEEKKLKGNLGWLAQEWAKEVSTRSGAAEAAAVLRALLAKFPGQENVANAAKGHVNNAVNALVASGKHEEALATVAQSKDLSGGEAETQRLTELAIDRWARTFMAQKDWDGAIGIYDRGLALYPEDSLFRQNRAYCLEQKGK